MEGGGGNDITRHRSHCRIQGVCQQFGETNWSAYSYLRGCVKLGTVAIGRQDAEFTQPIRDTFALRSKLFLRKSGASFEFNQQPWWFCVIPVVWFMGLGKVMPHLHSSLLPLLYLTQFSVYFPRALSLIPTHTCIPFCLYLYLLPIDLITRLFHKEESVLVTADRPCNLSEGEI